MTFNRFSGKVVRGNGRGRILGFPTANLRVHAPLPEAGVYSAWARVEAEVWQPATISVGDNPTFKDVAESRAECYFHHLNRNIYGAHVEIQIVAFLHGMLTFDRTADLIEQIRHDVDISRQLLTDTEPPPA